jgi:small subunit ribosomal protein S4
MYSDYDKLIIGGAWRRGKSKKVLQNPPLERPEWLSFDEEKRSAAVRRLPVEGEPPFPVELPLVVEYYATRL